MELDQPAPTISRRATGFLWRGVCKCALSTLAMASRRWLRSSPAWFVFSARRMALQPETERNDPRRASRGRLRTVMVDMPVAKTAAMPVICLSKCFSQCIPVRRQFNSAPELSVPNRLGADRAGRNLARSAPQTHLGPGGFEASAVSRLLAGNRRVPFDTPELARTRQQLNGDSNDTNIQAEL